MLNFFISILISLNVITKSEAPELTKEEVIKEIKNHAPEYMDIWDLSDEE
jgi:hypothetical protein|tara:strand:+ start:2602 stop:2751 length:150 start_codon:yes stop_codon:yes gene_type:complete